MRLAFLDTSVILRLILREKDPVSNLDQFERWYASRLLIVESRRVLERMYITKEHDEEQFGNRLQELKALSRGLAIISLRERILQRAEDSFPLALGTLDALHISSALLLQESLIQDSLVFITHDIPQAKAARACGLEVLGV